MGVDGQGGLFGPRNGNDVNVQTLEQDRACRCM